MLHRVIQHVAKVDGVHEHTEQRDTHHGDRDVAHHDHRRTRRPDQPQVDRTTKNHGRSHQQERTVDGEGEPGVQTAADDEGGKKDQSTVGADDCAECRPKLGAEEQATGNAQQRRRHCQDRRQVPRQRTAPEFDGEGIDRPEQLQGDGENNQAIGEVHRPLARVQANGFRHRQRDRGHPLTVHRGT